MNKIGLYIHIPFCKSKCPYCDFYSLRAGEEDFDNYVTCVIKALESYSRKINKKSDTLYFGGGTPSLIGADRLGRIIDKAKSLFDCDGEITVECNPSCTDDEFFKKLYHSGVNRVSLGMQSAVDNERKSLGRFADSEKVKEVINNSIASGIENISLDVMVGVPSQTEKSLQQTLDFCVNSGAKHISAYILKLEEGTWFYKNSHKLDIPDDDTTADLYLQMTDYLENNGFGQYEISNFAKDGFHSRHNLKYWNCEEYLGIGPSAHSFIDKKRFYYPRDLLFFADGKDPLPDGDGGDLNEYIMLCLRLKEGLVFEKCSQRFEGFSPEEYIKKAEPMAKAGLVRVDDNSLSLTAKGFLVSNLIIEKIVY